LLIGYFDRKPSFIDLLVAVKIVNCSVSKHPEQRSFRNATSLNLFYMPFFKTLYLRLWAHLAIAMSNTSSRPSPSIGWAAAANLHDICNS